MRKLIAVLTLAVMAVPIAPRAAEAEEADCTNQYVACLNDSYHLEGILQSMADLECFAEYTGCVTRKLIQA